jgi:hypothetical protein
MPIKVDGTNGVLQAYDYQTPSTGFSYTFAAGTQMLFMVPAGTLATGTITMPAAPADGMVITFSSSQQITALTLQGNTGQSISSAVTFLPAQAAAAYVYRLANTTWYPSETVPGTGTGSQLVLGTSQATTSGTSKDFTGIPSWVKRITLMCNGVSTNGSSALLVQLGAGSVTTTGYNSMAFTNATLGTSTIGLLLTQAVNSGLSQYGSYTISLFGSNTWILQGVGYQSPNFGAPAAGQIALGGTLDRLRFTTVNGTDTFDAGSVNIMYE